MAIPTSYPIRPAAQRTIPQPPPNLAENSETESGALQIVDFFEALPGPVLPPVAGSFPAVPPVATFREPHGIDVSNAARGTGYEGPIQTTQSSLGPRSFAALTVPNQSAEATLANLDSLTQSNTALIALAASQNLQDSVKEGVSQTVTNFSWGATSADTVNDIYQSARMGWTPASDGDGVEQSMRRLNGEAVLGNLSRAFDIPLQDLTSRDSQISGAARLELQQQLIDRVEEANLNENLDLPRAAFRGLVDAYEANHNSVVVAAGNQGQLLERMEADNGGRPLHTGPDFFSNVLAVPNATVVGALGPQTDGSVGVADYSSPSPAIDVNAWGKLPYGPEGTSFAAPRVAAVMQQLHVQNPTATSSEVEQMMMDRLFQQTRSEPPNAVAEYMNRQTW